MSETKAKDSEDSASQMDSSLDDEFKPLEIFLYIAFQGVCFHRVGEFVKYFTVFEDGILSLYKTRSKKKKVRSFKCVGCFFYDVSKTLNRECTIKVVTKNKNVFFVSADNLKDVDEFKVELEGAKGIFKGLERKIVTYDSSIEKKPPRKWSNVDCITWLRQIGLGGFSQKFEEKGVTGQILLEMDLGQFEKEMDLDREFAVTIFEEIRDLKLNKKFIKKRFVIKNKFKRFKGYKNEDYLSSPVVDALCDPVQIKHKFLSTAERFYYVELNQRENKVVDTKHFEKINTFNTAKVRIKLVVTEALQTNKKLMLKKVVSPFINQFVPTLTKKFQFFHTAVIVGPWYLEWSDSELIVPKRMVSGRAIITADVDTLYVKREGLHKISDLISLVVAKWNTKYRYVAEKGNSRQKRKEAEYYQGNCQDFVDDILNAVGAQPTFEGALGDFIQKMRLHGKADLEFVPCKEFKEYFKDKNVFTEDELNKGILFTSHSELDLFCYKINRNCFEINERFGSDWLLLKSFDRAFWMRQ